MNPFPKNFDNWSYFKRFFSALTFLLVGEVIEVAIRHNNYFGDPKETKWLFFRDTLALIAFTLLLARKTKKNTEEKH
jgi:hypothetical protein